MDWAWIQRIDTKKVLSVSNHILQVERIFWRWYYISVLFSVATQVHAILVYTFVLLPQVHVVQVFYYLDLRGFKEWTFFDRGEMIG